MLIDFMIKMSIFCCNVTFPSAMNELSEKLLFLDQVIKPKTNILM